MPGQKEVLKYELDIDDVEQKSRRLDELLDKQKSLASTGASDPALDAEIVALQGVTEESGKAAKGLAKVSDQSKSVAAGARGMARSFGGLGGLIGDVVASILEGSKALAGFIAVGLGITAVISLYKKLKNEIREMVELEREHNKLLAEAQAAALGPQAAIDQILLSKGGLTDSASEAASRTANRLGVQFGVSPDIAGRAAAFGTLGGLSFADTGILAAGIARGAQIDSRADVKRFSDTLTPETRSEFQRDLDELRRTTVGRETQAQAEFDQPAKGRTPANRLFDRLKETGSQPPGVEDGPQLEAYIDDLPELAKRLAVTSAATNLGSGGLGSIGRLFFSLKRDRLQAEFNRAKLLRDLLEREVRRDRGLVGGNVDLPELPVGDIPDPGATRAFLDEFNESPAGPPPAPRIGDFTERAPASQPTSGSAPTAQPTVTNFIRIGTLNARPGRGWLRRGGRPGFGTNSFNVADGGSA